MMALTPPLPGGPSSPDKKRSSLASQGGAATGEGAAVCFQVAEKRPEGDNRDSISSVEIRSYDLLKTIFAHF